MATTPYRCRLSPQDCPTSPEPGYCPHHPWIELVATTATTAGAEPARGAPAHNWGLRIVALDAVVPIPAEGLEIGRAPRLRTAALQGMAELVQISKFHARLTWDHDTLMVEDLGSSNGTFVDGEDIRAHLAPQAITPASRLRLAADVDVELVDLDDQL